MKTSIAATAVGAIAIASMINGAAFSAQMVFNRNAAQVLSHRPLKVPPNVMAMPMLLKNKGCTYYESANGGGQNWRKDVAWLAESASGQVTYAEVVNDTGSWWNDRISSVRCDDSDKVHCYTDLSADLNRKGQDVIVWGQQGLVNLASSGFDKKASSFAVFCTMIK